MYSSGWMGSTHDAFSLTGLFGLGQRLSGTTNCMLLPQNVPLQFYVFNPLPHFPVEDSQIVLGELFWGDPGNSSHFSLLVGDYLIKKSEF